ncbi:MAG: type VI secretion system ATPase TssH, partial [Deltaproteobacteria bacterium]|nr:type VI secretion system ATPase TssH [Deltaproteobacteria bacterium]
MDSSRLTEKSQEALQRAQSLAQRRNHQGVDIEHVLAALVESPEGLVPVILRQAGIAMAMVKQELERALNQIPQVSGSSGGLDKIYVTQRLARLLTRAEDEAREWKDEYVSVEQLR